MRQQPVDLIADIGGSTLRFALVEQGFVTRAATFEWPDPPSILNVAKAFLDGTSPRAVAMALASPVTGDDLLVMPNRLWQGQPWSFSQKQLQHDLGSGRLVILNDFTAVAQAVPRLTPADFVQVGGEGTPSPGWPVGVIGPGTGLGMSGVVWDGQRYRALTAEGGHATMPPASDRESEVLAVLRGKYDHVSAERLLSGMGLQNLHEALTILAGDTPHSLSPADITARALQGEDKICLEALEMFCAMLGTAASNLALTLGARGGIYVAGGIVPKILPFFQQSRFRARFAAKGRYQGYMQAIPTYVIIHESPAFLGLLDVLEA